MQTGDKGREKGYTDGYDDGEENLLLKKRGSLPVSMTDRFNGSKPMDESSTFPLPPPSPLFPLPDTTVSDFFVIVVKIFCEGLACNDSALDRPEIAVTRQ